MKILLVCILSFCGMNSFAKDKVAKKTLNMRGPAAAKSSFTADIIPNDGSFDADCSVALDDYDAQNGNINPDTQYCGRLAFVDDSLQKAVAEAIMKTHAKVIVTGKYENRKKGAIRFAVESVAAKK